MEDTKESIIAYLNNLNDYHFMNAILLSRSFEISQTLQGYIEQVINDNVKINSFLEGFVNPNKLTGINDIVEIIVKVKKRRDNFDLIKKIVLKLANILLYTSEKAYVVKETKKLYKQYAWYHISSAAITSWDSKDEIQAFCSELGEDEIKGFRNALRDKEGMHQNQKIWYTFISEEIFSSKLRGIESDGDLDESGFIALSNESPDLVPYFNFRDVDQYIDILDMDHILDKIREYTIFEKLGIDQEDIEQLVDRIDSLIVVEKFGIVNYQYYKKFFCQYDKYKSYIDKNGHWIKSDNKNYILHFVLFLDLMTKSFNKYIEDDATINFITDDFKLFDNIDSRNNSKRVNYLNKWRRSERIMEEANERAKALYYEYNK